MSTRITRGISRRPARSMLVAVPLAMSSAQAAAASDDIPRLVTTVCHACHMSDGNSIVPSFPKLAGQQAHYLEKQLNEWRLGRRDIDAMAAFLPQVTTAAVKELAAYYAAQARTPGTVLDPALAARGETLYLDGNEDSGVPACEACHQWEGQGNERYPRLAGQHQAYTVKALQDIRSDARDGGIMNRIAARMSDDEIRAVAEYIAGLPGTPQETP